MVSRVDYRMVLRVRHHATLPGFPGTQCQVPLRGFKGWGFLWTRGPYEKESERWRLFGENNADSRAVFLDFGIDADDIASQAQRAVRPLLDSGIIELDL